MEWTREDRYKGLESISEEKYTQMAKRVEKSPWRQYYHIQPVTGLLNDPNGFIYYKGKYHLFYQWFPLGPVHGLKYWYHVSSEDLATFKNEGPVVYPDTLYDSHGAYSGSSIQINDKLYIFYTGNHRTKDWERVPYQVYAQLNNDFQIIKKVPFISGSPNGYTKHVRDPKIWKNKDKYYLVLGAQNDNEKGRALIYQSKEPFEFNLLGEINTGLNEFGYMWECPDIFRIEDKDVFLFCPQGLEKEGNKYTNIYQSGYLVGNFDYDTLNMSHEGFNELDNGFDFYAPQTTLSADGDRILIGWMGLPDTEYPTDQYEWAHCMTLPRILTIENNQLKQRIHPNIFKLREKGIKQEFKLRNNSREWDLIEPGRLEIDFSIKDNSSEKITVLLANKVGESIEIDIDFIKNIFQLNRSNSGQLPSNQDDQKRSIDLDEIFSHMQVFIDNSSIEIFINDGSKVMSSRLFPREPYSQCQIKVEKGNADVEVNQYKLKRG